MDKISKIITCVTPALLWTFAGCVEVSAQEKPKKPNIIFIMNDDGGAGEFGCYGSEINKTPNIDEVARKGVRFETCFAVPVSTPSRILLMTGKYGHRTGALNNENKHGGKDSVEIYRNYYTMDKLMHDAGYVSAIAGKGYIPIMDLRESEFDEYCCWGEGLWLDDYNAKVCYHAVHPYDRNQKRIDPRTIGYKGKIFADGPSRYWQPFVIQNGKMLDTKEDDFGPDIYYNFVKDFIRKNKDTTFFVYYPMCLPHGTWKPDGGWDMFPVPDSTSVTGKSRTPVNYDDQMHLLIEYKDKLVGQLMKELEAQGLLENTIVFITADNGSGKYAKGQTTEAGVRVPMIVYWKGQTQEGYVAKDLIDFSDIITTFSDIVDYPLPSNNVFDGKSFEPVLYGKKGKRKYAFSYLRGERVIRLENWLLEENHESNYGRLYYCGDKRNGIEEYEDVTDEDSRRVRQIKRKFNRILKKHPAPAGLPYKTNKLIPGLEPVLLDKNYKD